MIKAFPKIFAIGKDYIRDIFEGEVEVTEKIDGSQFVFGKIAGKLYMRSKGSELFVDNPQKMFSGAVEHVLSIKNKIPDNTIFYCENLQQPRHNILAYERVPKNHIILFGTSDVSEKFYEDLDYYAELLEIERVPVIYKGLIQNPEKLLEMLETDSVLGGCKIEGVVVKNYSKQFMLGDVPIPLMSGKYVSEKFKENHHKNWGKEYSAKGKWDIFKESFRTEARWNKAIQHLEEKGELEKDPRDIGKLIKEIQMDITQEESEDIKDFLWKEYGSEVLRKATAGFPEWYKNKLLESAFK